MSRQQKVVVSIWKDVSFSGTNYKCAQQQANLCISYDHMVVCVLRQRSTTFIYFKAFKYSIHICIKYMCGYLSVELAPLYTIWARVISVVLGSKRMVMIFKFSAQSKSRSYLVCGQMPIITDVF